MDSLKLIYPKLTYIQRFSINQRIEEHLANPKSGVFPNWSNDLRKIKLTQADVAALTGDNPLESKPENEKPTDPKGQSPLEESGAPKREALLGKNRGIDSHPYNKKLANPPVEYSSEFDEASRLEARAELEAGAAASPRSLFRLAGETSSLTARDTLLYSTLKTLGAKTRQSFAFLANTLLVQSGVGPEGSGI